MGIVVAVVVAGDDGLTCDGAVDRAAVGDMIGVVDGIELGRPDGTAAVGNMEGLTVWDVTGNALGIIIDDGGVVGAVMATAGALDGMARGETDGAAIGTEVGGKMMSVGADEGTPCGTDVEGRRVDGFFVALVGPVERGEVEGVDADGTAAGRTDGAAVGMNV